MISKYDGGSAFPDPLWKGGQGVLTDPNKGMTLRDYFAIHSTQPGKLEIAMAANVELRDYHSNKVIQSEWIGLQTFHEWYHDTLTQRQRYDIHAKVRYQQADAMLRERDIPKKTTRR